MGDDNENIVGEALRRKYINLSKRMEGFRDKSLLSACLINEIKYLFSLLDSNSQQEILNKPWLDE